MAVGATRIVTPSTGAQLLAVRRARLRVVRGRDKGRELLLGERPAAVIGTDPDADLVLADDSVSWRHAELRADEGGYRLRDLGSTNGVRVGTLQVREALLTGKTALSLGDTQLEFTLADDEVEHELSPRSRFGEVLGAAPVMRSMFALLERAAQSDATVLVEGETGTGKESIAQSIHRASARAGGPFIVVDCGAIPPNLIEAELFGYEKGAFTGASTARAGALEEAAGGTLFLDEVGELPLEMQPRFLRALERRQVKRLGATAYRDVDLRVVAATNRDLAGAVTAGKFRSDLYYRLEVVKVVAPALRHHPEDIPLLARHLVEELRPGVDAGAYLSASVLGALSAYQWPGNVRELRNAIERMLALGVLSPLGGGTAPSASPHGTFSGDYHSARRDAIEQFEQDYCRALLAEADGVVAHAAERAGISRQMFHRLLRKHGLEEDSR
jgi:transcriptional regulator with PAS, ATPase and Fis domain